MLVTRPLLSWATWANVLLILSPQVFGLHASEAGVIDWHKPFIGVPLTSSPETAPTFHLISEEEESIILTATSSNVLAALNPTNGSISWRYIFEPIDPIQVFRASDNVVATLSGPGGAVLRTFDARTGHLLLELQLHRSDSGRLFEPGNLGTDLQFISDDASNKTGILVLTNGQELRYIDRASGDITWGWSAPDQSSLVIYSKILATPSTTYLIGLAKSFASYTLHVSALFPSSGEVLASVNIPSSISKGPSDPFILFRSPEPRVAWLEEGRVRVLRLSPELKEKPASLKGAGYKTIVDAGLTAHGHLVVVKTDGSASVLQVDGDQESTVKIWWGSSDSEGRAEALFAGTLGKDNSSIVARVASSHSEKQADAHVFSVQQTPKNDKQDDGKRLTFPFNRNSDGVIIHVALDHTATGQDLTSHRLLVTTSTGAVQLWQNDQLHWTREESLASIMTVQFVDLPERQAVTHAEEEGESFGARIERQVVDAQNFPAYLLNFIKRFATGSYATVSAPATPPITNSSSPISLSRDTFGFRKIIIAATASGKVFGIDSSSGSIVWSRMLGLGWAAKIGGRYHPLKMFVVRTVADGETPQVVLVAQRLANNGLDETVLFHIDALTGEDSLKKSSFDEPLKSFDIIEAPILEAFVLPNDNRTILLVDQMLQVHLYPETPETIHAFSTIAPSLYFALRSGAPGERRLTGHQILPIAEQNNKFMAYATWTTSFAPAEDIQTIIPHRPEPVASLGKVLANRTTLYKYLNPHLVVVLTVSRANVPVMCSIYLVDTVKGSIVYDASVPGAGGACQVKAVLSENWLVYHYYDERTSGVDQAKSYRMVSVELYEGRKPDDKTRSSEVSMYSGDSAEVTAYEQAFVFPVGITAITATTTKFGISTKDIVVANDRHQVQSVPRRILDPRRPKQKPTAQDMEELLYQYDPLVPDDQRRILSHLYQVAHVREVVTTPALLESTSLVLAYGLDLFFTRVSPSGTFDVLSENFNKAQLVLTIVGLGVAIMITKPMVRRKRLREKWYQS